MQIPFGDLKRQYLSIKNEIDNVIELTLQSGWFVLGKQVEAFEKAFAEYCGVKFAVGVGSGTEALHLALTVLGLNANDEVITVANTCVPTVSAISFANARIVLTDVFPESFTMDYHDLERKISQHTKAIIPVHLYGQPADMEPICAIAKKNQITVIEDAAQAHGTEYNGKRIGALSYMTCFSFYPSKNLGAYGDGGAITTNDEMLAGKLKMLRNYGQQERYFHSIKGFNSRLDEMQASILCAKLKYLDNWNDCRRKIAQFYKEHIHNKAVLLPVERNYGKHIYHLFVVRIDRRKEFQAYLTSRGIGTMIHYPVPIHFQESYRDLGYKEGDFPVTESLSKEIISLPIYPELTTEEILYICNVINDFR